MLKRVSIQNFKSLKDVTLDLQKVNLLIGPNNSGKTNFLKAFSAISKVVLDQEDVDYNDHYKKDFSKEINIHLVYDRNSTLYEHVVLDWVSDEDTGEFYGVYVGDSHDLYTNKDDISYDHRLNSASLYKICGEIIIYRPDPNKLDRAAPVGRGAQTVNADASNLIAFFDYIRDEKPKAFTQIRTDLNRCLPEFTEINFQSIEPTEDLLKIYGPATYKRIGLTDGRQGIIYWADELSEGTLYLIALLCIIHQPNPPKLLLLEEPERGIHPRRIREVMDFVFQLAEEKDIQIIMTSHNENVLNEFTSMPEAVFVFDKDQEEGYTIVKNLQKDIIEPSHQRSRENGTKEIDFVENLGENWMYGLLGGVPKDTL